VVGTPNALTGVVTGSVAGADADGDPLTYSGSTSTAKGSVTVTVAGELSYTPTRLARHAAALLSATDAQRSDTFTVTVSDGRGGTAAVPVTVSIAPVNAPPVAGAVTVGSPDSGAGAVVGIITATDADSDSLIYTAPATTAKGAIGINATTGSFTYTPTAAARQDAAAAAPGGAALHDSFTVTVGDGHGGTATAAVTVPVSPSSAPAIPLPAFPGAEGFGAYATGGRGGSVVYVTNLNTNGPGSLQWAIDQPGAKYILFKVSGVIDTQIHLTNGNVTIAGQTSPGGITVRGFVTDESPYQDQAVQPPADFAENWILQHIRIRPGTGGPSDDGLRMRYTRNAIVDHVSIGNATDEAIEISYSHDITVQNTLIAETVGGHSLYGGILMNYSNPAYGFGLDDVSLHHNVFNRIEGRLPEGSRESLAAANSYMNLEMSDNLYWDPGYFVTLGLTTNSLTDSHGNPYPIYWNLNAVNNYFRTGPGFIYGMFDDQILRTPRNNLYVSGNRMSLYPARSDYQLFYCCNDYRSVDNPADSAQQAHRLTSRNPFPAVTYTPTDQLVNLLLNTAGAWPRDPMDIRLMRSVATDTIASAPRNTNPAGDALLTAYAGAAPAAPTDTDNDGMPDSWESARGLDPTVANTNAHTLSSAGYTDLEVYLQELSTSRVTGWAG
jgi:VCBS repeat-containing protein